MQRGNLASGKLPLGSVSTCSLICPNSRRMQIMTSFFLLSRAFLCVSQRHHFFPHSSKNYVLARCCCRDQAYFLFSLPDRVLSLRFVINPPPLQTSPWRRSIARQITGRVASPTEPEVAAVHVPSKAVGFILGHRGSSIQALTDKTGAQIRVAPGSEVTTGGGEHRVGGGVFFFVSPEMTKLWCSFSRDDLALVLEK